MRKIDTCNKTLTAFLPHITFLSYFCVGNKLIPIYKPQNKMFHFCKTFCSKITLVNTIQNVI